MGWFQERSPLHTVLGLVQRETTLEPVARVTACGSGGVGGANTWLQMLEGGEMASPSPKDASQGWRKLTRFELVLC